MQTHHATVINAPLVNVFGVVSDLKRWPEFLPCYRTSSFLSPMPWGGIVKMSCVCMGWTIAWVALYRIDTDILQFQFEHLTPLTRGMGCVWRFEETPQGVQVSATHQFTPHGLGRSWMAGYLLTGQVVRQTLAEMKRRLEKGST